MAHCLAREGYLTAAIQEYQEFTLRAGEPWPEDADPRRLAEAQNLLRAAHSNQGDLHELLDQPAEAARALGLAAAFDPENLELIRKQVELFAQARLYEPAIAAAMSLAEKDVELALIIKRPTLRWQRHSVGRGARPSAQCSLTGGKACILKQR